MNDVNCKHSNQMVPYMYGELATTAATEFESHLLDCHTCTDEFAALSAARYEVYDWKKVEFDPLATPSIEIPFGEVAAVSWIEKLRAAFAGWAMPAAAFAGLALVVTMIGVFVVSRDSQPDVAKGGNRDLANDNTNVTKPVAPSIAPAPQKPTQIEVKSPERSSPGPIPVKDPGQKRLVHTEQTVAPRSPHTRKTITAQTPNVPRLNDFAEEEDSSLRLAELFEDIDTRE